MLNFLNIAAQNGILVKDARTLDRLSSIDVIVFDKTGTLTIEQPHVVAVHACAGCSEQTVLAYAAAGEQHQAHPIARAILQEAAARYLTLPTSDYVHYEVGYGLRVTIGDTLVRVGSLRFLEQAGITIPPEIQSLHHVCHAVGNSLVLVGLNDQLGGAIELQPTIRPEAPAVIKALQQRGLAVAIISGDQETPTQVLADRLGVDTYFANTLPTQKSQLIQQLQAEGKTVCFVGDGINDAIALKQADVSISIRGATSIATDTAQVVLMNQQLTQILDLLQMSRKVDNNLKASIVSLTLPDVIFIGGVFLLHWGVYAAFATFIISLFGSVGTAMVPLLEQRWKGKLIAGKDE